MLIGVPSEIKSQESRVGLTPESVKQLVNNGHQVMVQDQAGYSCFKKLFEGGLSLKATADCLIVAPPFVCEKEHIDEIIEKLRTGITNYMKS